MFFGRAARQASLEQQQQQRGHDVVNFATVATTTTNAAATATGGPKHGAHYATRASRARRYSRPARGSDSSSRSNSSSNLNSSRAESRCSGPARGANLGDLLAGTQQRPDEQRRASFSQHISSGPGGTRTTLLRRTATASGTMSARAQEAEPSAGANLVGRSQHWCEVAPASGGVQPQSWLPLGQDSAEGPQSQLQQQQPQQQQQRFKAKDLSYVDDGIR